MTKLILEEIRKLGERMTVLQNTVDGLVEDVKQLKDDVAELKTDVAELKTDVAGLKTDVSNLRSEVDYIKENFVTKKHFEKSVKLLVTRFEFEDFQQWVYENMFTKQDWSEHQSGWDAVMKEFKATQISNTLIGPRYADLDDTVASHENRISHLEAGQKNQ